MEQEGHAAGHEGYRHGQLPRCPGPGCHLQAFAEVRGRVPGVCRPCPDQHLRPSLGSLLPLRRCLGLLCAAAFEPVLLRGLLQAQER